METIDKTVLKPEITPVSCSLARKVTQLCPYRDGDQGDYEDYFDLLDENSSGVHLCTLTDFATMCYSVHCTLLLLFIHYTFVFNFFGFSENTWRSSKRNWPRKGSRWMWTLSGGST
jgi:hypothetical protein